MNVNDLFPSKYLKAHDLGGKSFTLTIRAATLEDVGHGAEKERKLAIAFEKATKMMLLNRTNAMIIASMYGPETDGWKGKAVTIYSARVKAFGAWHDALRIKEQIPARNVGAAQMTDAMQEEPPLDDENDLLDVEEGESPRVDPETGEILDAKTSASVDNPFEDVDFSKPKWTPPTKEELETLSMWKSSDDAYVWAVDNGACKAIEHAKNSMKKMAADNNMRFTAENKDAIFLATLRHWNENIAQQERIPVLA